MEKIMNGHTFTFMGFKNNTRVNVNHIIRENNDSAMVDKFGQDRSKNFATKGLYKYMQLLKKLISMFPKTTNVLSPCSKF